MTRLNLSLIIKVVAVGLISLYHAPLFLDLLGEEWGPVVGVPHELQTGWLALGEKGDISNFCTNPEKYYSLTRNVTVLSKGKTCQVTAADILPDYKSICVM